MSWLTFFGYAVLFAEKLCFSVRSIIDLAATPPLLDAVRIVGTAALAE